MTNSVMSLFPIPVFHTNLNGNLFSNELNGIGNEINNEKNFRFNGNGNLTSNDDCVLDNWNLANIKKQIVESIRTFSNNILCYDYDNFYITQSWINVNPPKSSHHSHKHKNSVLSGVLFLDTFEGCGNIQFYCPHSDKQLTPKIKFVENNDLTWGHYYFTPSNNDLIIFPSYLEHSVSQNLSTYNRVSLSFNTFFTPIGVRDTLGFIPDLNSLESFSSQNE